jgi:hypothetical protein
MLQTHFIGGGDMKHLLLIIAIILLTILSFSTKGMSQDCNIEIREGHVSEDILRILHCMDGRIKKIEDEKGISRNVIVNPKTRDAGDFIATVSGASKENNQVHVSVGLHNKTSEPILLAINGYPSLMEQSTGKVWQFRSCMPIRLLGGGDTNANDYVSIPGADNCTLNFSFVLDGSRENAFNLDLVFWRLKNGEVTQLPIVPLRFIIN